MSQSTVPQNLSFHQLSALSSIKVPFVVGIIMFHFGKYFGYPFNNICHVFYAYGGYLGNYIFFLISGILIAHTYKIRLQRRELSINQFCRKRVRKIYPAYLASNCVSLLHSLSKLGIKAINLENLLEVVTLTSAGWIHDRYPYNFPTWFVNMIVLCYLLYGCIAYISNGSDAIYYSGLWIMIVSGSIILNIQWRGAFLYRHNGEGFSSFFFGCLLYEVYLKKPVSGSVAMIIMYYLILLTVVLLSNCYGYRVIAGNVSTASIFIICPCIILICINKPLDVIFTRSVCCYLGKNTMLVSFWHAPYYYVFRKVMSRLGRVEHLLPESLQMILYIGSLFALCVVWERLDKLIRVSST